MATIRIAVETDDNKLSFDLLGNPRRIGPGSKITIPGNAELIMSRMQMRKGFGFPETLEFLLSFGSGVAYERTHEKEPGFLGVMGTLNLYCKDG